MAGDRNGRPAGKKESSHECTEWLARLFPRSFPARFLIRSWEYRHPGAWMNVRLACPVFNLGLCLVLFSFGAWEGVIPLAAAALIFWTRNVLRQSTQS